MRPLTPGDRIKLTGTFIRNAGARAEARHEWTVEACACPACAAGERVATNDRGSLRTYLSAEEIAEETAKGHNLNRHFHVANVYRVGTLDSRNAL